MESSLFPIEDMITWIFWELSLASKENPLACPIAVSREAHKFALISLTNPCSDDDKNNDVGSLYVEIIDKNRSYYKCTICGRKLSRKQSKFGWCADRFVDQFQLNMTQATIQDK